MEYNNFDRKLMFTPLTGKIFDLMFKIKSDDIKPVLAYYELDAKALHDLLFTQFNIPGMEVRIANTAFDYLICCCESNMDLKDKTLPEKIKDCILMSGVFYTNIAPDAAHTSEFQEYKI